MYSFDDVFAAIVEVIVRLLYGVVRLIIWVIGFFLSQTWLVNHFEAIRRFGWWLALATALYLLFGIVRASVTAFATPALTPYYQWQTILIAIVLLLFGIALRELDKSRYEVGTGRPTRTDTMTSPRNAATDGPIQTQPTIHSAGIIAAVVAGVVIVGVISAVSSERHEATLAEKLCAEADARISDGVEQAVRDGAGLLDRVLGTHTATRIPCSDD